MRTFAYIVTPVTIKELKKYRPLIRPLPDFLIKQLQKTLFSIKAIRIRRVKSIRGREIEGYLVICPLIGADLSEDFVVDKIIVAAQTAQRLGAKIVGLDAYAAKFADTAYPKILKNLRIPITSGNSLNAWSVVEHIYRIARIKKQDLKKSAIAVIGSASPTGTLCSKKLSDFVNRIILTDKDMNKLEKIKEDISYVNPIEVQIEGDARKASQKADIVVNLDNAILNIEDLKPNVILCTINPNTDLFNQKKLRSDITFAESGLVKLPFPEKFYNNFGLPRGIVPASMAETMLLTLEERFVSYSLGEKINPDKLEEIADTAALHGFEIWCPDAPVI